jgi:hypothetical protein
MIGSACGMRQTATSRSVEIEQGMDSANHAILGLRGSWDGINNKPSHPRVAQIECIVTLMVG